MALGTGLARPGALGLATPAGAVVYFDHELGELYEKTLAPDFFQFVDRVMQLDGVGNHGYEQFLGPQGLDPALRRR